VPLLLLVLPAMALAQPAGGEVEPLVRQVELSQVPRPELWVAPGQATVVGLDTPLNVEATRQANGAEGLRRVEVAERAVTLVPSAGAKEGTQLEFTLRFADGQPAEGVTLLLRVDSARAEPEVELYRGAIPAEALKRRLSTLNARLEAQRAQEPGLTSLMAAGLLGSTGVRSREVGGLVEIQGPGLTASGGWHHMATGRMALEVTLTVPPGATLWVPGTVRLTEKSDPEPLPVRSMKLLEGAALPPGSTGRLLVEWDTPLQAEGLQYTVEVSERHGKRAVKVTLEPPTRGSAVAPLKEKKP
jgi:uncharacterized protein (TIGR02268 family)